jgi:hypothetical protein
MAPLGLPVGITERVILEPLRDVRLRRARSHSWAVVAESALHTRSDAESYGEGSTEPDHPDEFR